MILFYSHEKEYGKAHTLLFSVCAEAMVLRPSPSWPSALDFHESGTMLPPVNNHLQHQNLFPFRKLKFPRIEFTITTYRAQLHQDTANTPYITWITPSEPCKNLISLHSCLIPTGIALSDKNNPVKTPKNRCYQE